MTPPIPIDGMRKRPSRSCTNCRRSKTRCNGISEEYLHQVSDPEAVLPSNPPQCTRCIKLGFDCSFVALKRKGRPRRCDVPVRPRKKKPSKALPSPSTTPEPQDYYQDYCSSPNFFEDLDRYYPDPFASPYHVDASTTMTSPEPFVSTYRITPSHTTASPAEPAYFESPIVVDYTLPPTMLPSPSYDYKDLADAYLREVFQYSPLLPPEPVKLQQYLANSDPFLPAALACIIDPLSTPPTFPPLRPTSLAILQGCIYLGLYYYGIQEVAKCVEIVEYASREMRILGWKGSDTSSMSQVVRAEELNAFVGVGWIVWCFGIRVGILVGDRGLLLTEVRLPSEIDPSDMILHAVQLLRDSTDFATLDQLDQEARSAYTEDIVARSAQIYEVATSYLQTLNSSSQVSSPSSKAQPKTSIASNIESLTLAAARETAFVTAVMAASSPILLLSHDSPYSSIISPILSCNLHSATYPSENSRSIILHCVDQILETARTARAENGDLIAFLQHCACWGPGFLICGWGILISYEASIMEGCEGDLDTTTAEEGLDLCEAILASQTKWSAQALFGAELGLMRQTSLLYRGEAPRFDDGWSEEVFAPCL